MESLVERLSCSYCGQHDFKQVGRFTNSRLIQLILCINCNLVSTDYFPSESYLHAYYTHQFPRLVQKYNAKEEISVTFSKPERFAKRLFSLLPAAVFGLKEINILDFGGGDGTLAIEFAKLLNPKCLINITVIDFGDSIAHCDLANTSIRKLQDIPSLAKYDLVIASASIELIADFGKILKSLLNSLRQKDSCLYVRSNYILPVKKLLPFVDFTFPAHLHDISPDFWRRFAEIEGAKYSVLKTETPISELDFQNFPLRWIFSSLLKLPSRIERYVFTKTTKILWKFVGSWEVVISKNT